MNKKIYIFALTLMVFFVACDKDDMEYETDYERSYKAWQSFKESNNNSYRYVVNRSSWSGFAWETALTVQAGEVTERAFRYTVFNDIRISDAGWSLETVQLMIDSLEKRHPGSTQQTPSVDSLMKVLSWSEQQTNLNDPSHSGGAPTWTIDQVYEQAKNDWLRKRDNAQSSFEAKNNGIISSCGYWEDGCMDDCFRGISISSVEAL